jgi:hypothetical protein
MTSVTYVFGLSVTDVPGCSDYSCLFVSASKRVFCS